MKKLLIGCGCGGLILLAAGLAFIGVQAYPIYKEIEEQGSRYDAKIELLDEEHPFSPDAQTELDTERFATALELRVELRQGLDRWQEGLRQFGEDAEAEELGVWDVIEQLQQDPTILFSDVLQEIPATLGASAMGPTEFAYYTRLLWATLESIEAGTGGPDLDPLRGRYLVLKDFYARDVKRQQPKAPDLDQIVGSFDPAVVLAAKQVLGTDTTRVLDGIAPPELEIVYMVGLKLGFQAVFAAVSGQGVVISNDGSHVQPSPEVPEIPEDR